VQPPDFLACDIFFCDLEEKDKPASVRDLGSSPESLILQTGK